MQPGVVRQYRVYRKVPTTDVTSLSRLLSSSSVLASDSLRERQDERSVLAPAEPDAMMPIGTASATPIASAMPDLHAR